MALTRRVVCTCSFQHIKCSNVICITFAEKNRNLTFISLVYHVCSISIYIDELAT